MKKIKIAFYSLLLLSTATSCEKVLDVEETDFIGGDIALATVGNTEQGVIGAYAGMNTEMGILFNSVVSDEVKTAEFYNSATVHEWAYGPNDISIRDQFTAIRLYYRVIDRVNRVLEALPNADSIKPTDNAALRARVKGEALFIRAFCHFELYRFYCDNYTPGGLAMEYAETSGLTPAPRITMEPYFAKLKADLAEAKMLLPTSTADVYRANMVAVSGLQARIALYQKDWAGAATFATEYISALPLATRAQFPAIWTDANTSVETAFRLRRTNAIGGRIGSLYRNTSANATAIGTVIWAPTNELWSVYDQTNDVRFGAYLKEEPILAAAGRPSRLVNKYAGTTYGTASENVADAKVFRTGEMILIRAEAKAEQDDLAGAAADVSLLRAARITGATPVLFASKDAAIAGIINERFLELPFEGHRFWDLKRKGLPVTREGIIPLGDAPNANSTTLPAGNFRFLLPIPQSEIDANTVIQQNPGYER